MDEDAPDLPPDPERPGDRHPTTKMSSPSDTGPTHPNELVVRRFYAARAAGDRATVIELLDADVAWHDPYPPPHGGDLIGRDAVLRDVFDAASKLTGGSTRLWLHDVIANDRHAVALVHWSSTYRNRTMEGREVAVFRVDGPRIAEAWFYPENASEAWEFFS